MPWKTIIVLLMCGFSAIQAAAFDFRTFPKAHPTDTLTASHLLEVAGEKGDLSDKIAAVARRLIGKTSDDYYRKDSIATLRLNFEEFTPLTFINSVLAVASSSQSYSRPTWREVAEKFESLSCRRGENKGFPSIMYHTSDWINDNVFRGNLKEITENYSGVVVRTKSLDELSRNRSNYAALADSATFETVRMTELGFRTHRVPTLKREIVQKKEFLEDLREGDILILVPGRDGIDCYDMGFVVKEDEVPHLLHISPATGKIEIESDDLGRYFKLISKYFQGFRVIRLSGS